MKMHRLIKHSNKQLLEANHSTSNQFHIHGMQCEYARLLRAGIFFLKLFYRFLLFTKDSLTSNMSTRWHD